MPDEAEAIGLLALMLLHDSRRDTRVDADGALVLLADQDRSRWHHEQIAEGIALVERALRRHDVGPYQLQAAIAAVHAGAASPADTDWAEIAALYGELLARQPTPVVELNRAVAIAMAEGPGAGWCCSTTSPPPASSTPTTSSTPLGPTCSAAPVATPRPCRPTGPAWARALEHAATDAERDFLTRRLEEVREAAGP